MLSNSLKTSALPAVGAIVLAGSFLLPTANAGTAPMMDTMTAAPSPTWKWGLSVDYMYRDVDRSQDYLSAPYDWHVDYDDFNGDLWGGTIFVTPPCFADLTIDFSYRTGDLNGIFRNHSLDPQDPDFGTVYEGDARFDRDEYVVGLTYPCPSPGWLYVRAEYFNFQEDGTWDYGGGETEDQSYTLWGIATGVGARQGYPLGGSGAILDLNAFVGLVYFDSEHEETGYATTSWDGWGFLVRAGARVSYPIQTNLDVFLGCGYEYLQTDDGSLDMTNQGLFVNLGLKGEF